MTRRGADAMAAAMDPLSHARERKAPVRPVPMGIALLFLLPAVAPAQGVVEYYHLDALGSVRVVTNSSGGVVERRDYLPFGEECTANACASNPQGNGQRFRFTGKERDAETGLDYFGARYYGADIARLTTVDPVVNVSSALTNPQRWNRYAYAVNNPLKYIDPDGRDVSIALEFTGDGWSHDDKSAVIERVAGWYRDQGVGNVYVFDAAEKKHDAWFANLGWRQGYASVEVSMRRSDLHRPDLVFAGNFADLPQAKRLNAIANTIVHETAMHQFGVTGATQVFDTAVYQRSGGRPIEDVWKRYGTVADSWAFADEGTRPNVLNGPIPIHPEDHADLIKRVGPGHHVNPPVPR